MKYLLGCLDLLKKTFYLELPVEYLFLSVHITDMCVICTAYCMVCNPLIQDSMVWINNVCRLVKEPVRCNGRKNTTHTLNPTTITQDHNRSISFIFARHHICVAAYPPSHPRRRWPRCSHKTTKNVCWIWLILRRLSLPLSSLSLSLSLSLARFLSLSRWEICCFPLRHFSEVCMCSYRCFLFPIWL